jgi:hypothetical protein
MVAHPTRDLSKMQLTGCGAISTDITEIVALIDQLLDQYTDDGVAKMLNARGYISGTGRPFHSGIVQHIRHEYELRSRYAGLRARGLLTPDEMADALRPSGHREDLRAARPASAVCQH